MSTIGNKIHSIMLTIFIISNSIAQINLNNTELHEAKVFTKNPINVIQSLYLDAEGMPSHDIFLRTNGLYPLNINTQSTPYFMVSFLKDDVLGTKGEFKLSESVELLNLDFYVETITKYNAANIAVPIWDGRVYEDKNNLIVGGYSSKFNERPVGIINSKGLFVTQLDGVYSKEFPILQIPAEQIIFDPFQWKLLKMEPSKGEIIQKSTSSFLPIKIYKQNGELLNTTRFELENHPTTSSLVLYGIIDGKNLKWLVVV